MGFERTYSLRAVFKPLELVSYTKHYNISVIINKKEFDNIICLPDESYTFNGQFYGFIFAESVSHVFRSLTVRSPTLEDTNLNVVTLPGTGSWADMIIKDRKITRKIRPGVFPYQMNQIISEVCKMAFKD